MRNGEKMYSEFEWRNLIDKTVTILRSFAKLEV